MIADALHHDKADCICCRDRIYQSSIFELPWVGLLESWPDKFEVVEVPSAHIFCQLYRSDIVSGGLAFCGMRVQRV